MKKKLAIKITYDSYNDERVIPVVKIYYRNGVSTINQSNMVTLAKTWLEECERGFCLSDLYEDAVIFQIVKASKKAITKKIDFEFVQIIEFDVLDFTFEIKIDELDELTKDEIKYIEEVSITIPAFRDQFWDDWLKVDQDKVKREKGNLHNEIQKAIKKYFDEEYEIVDDSIFEEEQRLLEEEEQEFRERSDPAGDAWRDILDGDGWKHGIGE